MSAIHTSISRVLLDIGSDHSIFARNPDGTYASKHAGKDRRRVWQSLTQQGFRVGEIARATGANVATVSMATSGSKPPPENQTMPQPTASPKPATPPAAPSPPKADRFDDLFNWHHAIILEAVAAADPEPFNYSALLAKDPRVIGWISRLQTGGLIDSLTADEDPHGRSIIITKAGQRELGRWKAKHGKTPPPDVIDADLYRLAVESTRRANGLPLPGQKPARVPVVAPHELDADDKGPASDDDRDADELTEGSESDLGALPEPEAD